MSISGRSLALIVILALGIIFAFVMFDTSSSLEGTKHSPARVEKPSGLIMKTFQSEILPTPIVKTEEMSDPVIQKEPKAIWPLFENEKLQIALTCREDPCFLTDSNTTQPIYIKITQYANTLDIQHLELNTSLILSAGHLDFLIKEKQKNIFRFGNADPLTQMEANRSYIVQLSIDTNPIGVEIIENPQLDTSNKISSDTNTTLDPKKTYYINGYRLHFVESNNTADNNKTTVLQTFRKITP